MRNNAGSLRLCAASNTPNITLNSGSNISLSANTVINGDSYTSGNGYIAGGLEVNGFMSIGNAVTSSYPLWVVDGPSAPINYTKSAYFGQNGGFVYDVVLTGSTWTQGNTSIYTQGNILSGRWIAGVSDERIKKDVKLIQNSLDKLLKLKPKTYKYIDEIKKGFNDNYGFIAQEVKEIIPEAVETIKDFIPNIYKSFDILDNIIFTNEDLSSELKVNDSIKIIDEIKIENNECKILEINNKYIKIDKTIKGTKYFIYGKLVEDYHTLSKEHLFSLNISATQELYKIIQQQQLDHMKETQELYKIIQQQQLIINDIQNILMLLKNK